MMHLLYSIFQNTVIFQQILRLIQQSPTFRSENLPSNYIRLIIQMQEQKLKQKLFQFQNIRIDSQFECGNLQEVTMPSENQFNIWIGSDDNANFKTWFFFSIEGIKLGSFVTFTIMNMNNQVKLFKQGHLPVFKTENNQKWSRIKIPIAQNGVIKVESGFQIIFKHNFTQKCKHYFAFTFPWTIQQNNRLIQSLMQSVTPNTFCKSQQLCKSFKGRPLTLLTVTKSVEGQLKFGQKKIGKNQIIVFQERKGIFISSRVHPGQTASSHIMNGILKCLFSKNQISQSLLQNCVFYMIPIVNPDGVAEGNFRTDCQGKNLNRYYTNPSSESEPQIYYIKQFLLQMIKQKRISFCLDLHAHVNKQGAFIYGNSTNNLYTQMRVCLFAKLLSFNSQIFDYQSCNFSEKNMTSKDKGEELSKQGASRVAIFKDTGLVQCWTLQCNYNSARLVHPLMQPSVQSKNSSVSYSLLSSKIQPEDKQQLKYLNIQQFQDLGFSICESISDFYFLRPYVRAFSTKLKNMNNLFTNTAISCLRLIPFRFDTQCRKILDNINGGISLKANIQKIQQIINNKVQKIGYYSVSIQQRKIKSEQNNAISNSKRQVNGKKQSLKVGSLKKQQKNSTRQIIVLKKVKIQEKVRPPLPLKSQKSKKEDYKSITTKIIQAEDRRNKIYKF